MRPHAIWVAWLRAAETSGNSLALAAAELALLAVHGVSAKNAGGLAWKVCVDRRSPDVLAAEYLKYVRHGGASR
jgi:hypothetical protein